MLELVLISVPFWHRITGQENSNLQKLRKYGCYLSPLSQRLLLFPHLLSNLVFYHLYPTALSALQTHSSLVYSLADSGQTQSYRTSSQDRGDSPKDRGFGWWCTEITSLKSSLSGLSVHGKWMIWADNESLPPPQLYWNLVCRRWSCVTWSLWGHDEGDQISCTSLSDGSQTPFAQGKSSLLLVYKSSMSLHNLTQQRRLQACLFPILIWKEMVPTAMVVAGDFPRPSGERFSRLRPWS